MAKDKKQVATREGKTKRRMGRIRQYFREVGAELKKATWPTKKELAKYTGVVLAFVAIFAVIVGLMDLGLTELLKLITG